MKINNLTNILTCIFAHNTATKAQLVQLTGLSNSTVSASVNSLLKLDLLVCDGMEESIGGRRSRIYKLNKDYGCFVGVEMDAVSIAVCITDCENNSLESTRCLLDQSTPVINQLIVLLDHVFEKHDKILGLGVGLTALIDYKEQVVLDCPDYGWKNVPLKEILERHFTVFVTIDHKVNGAALREGLLGQASSEKNYLCVYEAAKGKAALILDDDICRGLHNSVGKADDVSLLPLLNSGLLSFLNVSLVIVGYYTEEYKNEIAQLAQADAKNVICIPEADQDFAIGMAAVAQKCWFKSIYFML